MVRSLIGPSPRSVRRVRLLSGTPSLVGSLVVLLAACSTPAASPSTLPTDGPSGITGIVLVGPDCRRPTEASPCLVPYQARLVILDPDGRIVGEVTSGSDGSFRIELPPGDYVVQPSPGGDPYPRAEARSVTVVTGEMSEVEIDYERGRG